MEKLIKDVKIICKNCYWCAERKDSGGDCHYYPPQKGQSNIPYWAPVNLNDWCSKFQWGYETNRKL